jgi:hypothetical protein
MSCSGRRRCARSGSRSAPLALGLQTTLAPGAGGSGLELGNVLVLVIWGAVGIRIAGKRFKWEPQAANA